MNISDNNTTHHLVNVNRKQKSVTKKNTNPKSKNNKSEHGKIHNLRMKLFKAKNAKYEASKKNIPTQKGVLNFRA